MTTISNALTFLKHHVSHSCHFCWQMLPRPLGQKGCEQGGSPTLQAPTISQPCVCSCTPSRDWVFPGIKEVGSQTLSSLTFPGVAPPTDRGCNGAPAPHYLTGGARESGGAADGSALCLGMAGLPGGPGVGGWWLSGLLSVRDWLLAPRGQRAAFSASSGANFLFGRENRKTPSLQEMIFFLQSLFRWPWLVGRDHWGGPPWLGVPNSILSPWSPEGDGDLHAMIADPTSPASLI